MKGTTTCVADLFARTCSTTLDVTIPVSLSDRPAPRIREYLERCLVAASFRRQLGHLPLTKPSPEQSARFFTPLPLSYVYSAEAGAMELVDFKERWTADLLRSRWRKRQDLSNV